MDLHYKFEVNANQTGCHGYIDTIFMTTHTLSTTVHTLSVILHGLSTSAHVRQVHDVSDATHNVAIFEPTYDDHNQHDSFKQLKTVVPACQPWPIVPRQCRPPRC